MATTAENTSVYPNHIHSQNVQGSNGKQVNVMNGKLKQQNNGYVKSTHLSNGVTVSRRSFIFPFIEKLVGTFIA